MYKDSNARTRSLLLVYGAGIVFKPSDWTRRMRKVTGTVSALGPPIKCSIRHLYTACQAFVFNDIRTRGNLFHRPPRATPDQEFQDCISHSLRVTSPARVFPFESCTKRLNTGSTGSFALKANSTASAAPKPAL